MNINYYEKIKKVFILLITKKNLFCVTNVDQPANSRDGVGK